MSEKNTEQQSPSVEQFILKSPKEIFSHQNTPNLQSVTRAFQAHLFLKEANYANSPMLFFKKLKTLA